MFESCYISIFLVFLLTTFLGRLRVKPKGSSIVDRFWGGGVGAIVWTIVFCTLLNWDKMLFAAGVSPDSELPFKIIYFQVKDANDGKILSVGVEKIRIENGVVSKDTVYFLGQDKSKIIQQETCAFDFETLRPDSYTFSNSISGERVSIKLAPPPALDGQVEYQVNAGAAMSKSKVQWNTNMILGKTLHHTILRAWGKLLDGRPRAFQLYVPMKQEQYSFRVNKAEKDKSYKLEDSVLISLELDNWVLRHLAPSMHFYYSSKSGSPQLIRYEGPTTVVLDDEIDRKVIVDFQYES